MDPIPVELIVSEPWEFGEAIAWRRICARVIGLRPALDGGRALVEFAEPLMYGGTTYRCAVASPRHVGHSISELVDGEPVNAFLTAVPAERMNTDDRFDANWCRSGLGFLATIQPLQRRPPSANVPAVPSGRVVQSAAAFAADAEREIMAAVTQIFFPQGLSLAETVSEPGFVRITVRSTASFVVVTADPRDRLLYWVGPLLYDEVPPSEIWLDPTTSPCRYSLDFFARLRPDRLCGDGKSAFYNSRHSALDGAKAVSLLAAEELRGDWSSRAALDEMILERRRDAEHWDRLIRETIQTPDEVYAAVRRLIADLQAAGGRELAAVLDHRLTQVAWTSQAELFQELHSELERALRPGASLPPSLLPRVNDILRDIRDHLGHLGS